MADCLNCGFPLYEASHCPKCDASRESKRHGTVHEIDVAHSGESWEQAKSMILDGLSIAIKTHCKALRVIHGYGARSGVSVIAPHAISLMRHLAETHDARYAKDTNNPGLSIIWLNKGRSNRSKNEVRYQHEALQHSKLPVPNWFDLAQQKKY